MEKEFGLPPRPEHLAPIGGLIGLAGAIKWLLKRGAMIATATIAGIGIAVAIIVAILYGHPH